MSRPALRVVLVWILLEAAGALQVHGPDGAVLVITWLRTAVQPVVWSTTRIHEFAGDLGSGLGDVRRLSSDNEALRSRIEQLQMENTILRTDLAATRDALEVALTTPTTRFEVGRCLYRDLARGTLVVSIPPGVGIRSNSAVLGPDGLIGRVIRVEGARCWVESLVTPGAAVAVQTGDRAHQGITEGAGRDDLRVQYIGRQAAVTRDQVLTTSGADGLYPPDLPVARVVAVRESASPFLTIRARPVVDLARIRAVAILTGLDFTTEATAQ